MSRGYRLAAIISLAALLSGAVPASAAPVGGWSLFGSFSPFDWVRGLWEAETVPWQRTGDGDPEPAGAPHSLWAETGSGIDPSGQPMAVLQPEGVGAAPSVLQ